MRVLNQVFQITIVNLWTIPQRLGTSLVIVVGIAGVVGVLVSVLAMSRGFEHTLASTGRASRIMMLRAGSDAEMSSDISREHAAILAAMPNVARNGDGRPLASAELVLMRDLARKGGTDPNNVPFRAVQDAAFEIRDELRIVEGRRFERGRREVIVGAKAADQFAGLFVGSRFEFRDSDWTVVGIFTTGGDVHETEIWADAEVAMSSFRRLSYQSLTATLEDASEPAFETMKARIDDDPRFSINVLREPEYYARQSKTLATLIDVLGYMVASFMAVGAMFGALNCMYSAVASRQKEIATLRAIGFGSVPVVVSVMLEALALSLLGGTIGAALAYIYCNGASLSTLNFNTFSQVAFDFRVTTDLILQGLLWSLVIGLVGGLFPAIRAARLPVVEALRTS
ncbi:MAG TPA: ABC transporter permease [Candidatus Binatia bacterium]|nr:ABC transporter permease [Candidatus Binatia bacterium]